MKPDSKMMMMMMIVNDHLSKIVPTPATAASRIHAPAGAYSLFLGELQNFTVFRRNKKKTDTNYQSNYAETCHLQQHGFVKVNNMSYYPNINVVSASDNTAVH